MPRGRTPLREQRFRLIVLVAGPLFAFVIVAALFAGGRFPGLAPELFFVISGVLLILTVGGIAVGFFIGNKLVGDRVELAYRAPADKWRHGRAEIQPGVVKLQRYWWQIRIPVGDPITLDVESIGQEERKPRARQWWSMNPQLRIVTMATAQGVYEIGALPSHLAEVRDRLAS